MKEISVGKLRGLSRCTSQGGAMSVLALDHRNNLRRALNPEHPDSVNPAEMSTFKQMLVRALASSSTAVLLDPEVGAAQCISDSSLPGTTGLVVAVEATGYEGAPDSRLSRILNGWSVEKARRMGADAVKLLVYYHPKASTARLIEELVVQVAEDCLKSDILFMLEPLSFSLDSGQKKLMPQERREVVIETAAQLTVEGVDILKAEFPVDAGIDREEASWAKACAELSSACPVPWVVLSAGVDFETYLRQVVVACESGASGVAAGRAVWAETVKLPEEERSHFLTSEARGRMRRLTSICEALGRSTYPFFKPPEVDSQWHKQY